MFYLAGGMLPASLSITNNLPILAISGKIPINLTQPVKNIESVEGSAGCAWAGQTPNKRPGFYLMTKGSSQMGREVIA